ncbi:HSPB1 associated protein 1 [Haematobia irritans]|uniref:HSPB1 associated protein 1 n=1 Tax=Haematobia irritans TaxID=7368 RepID=UPI003F4F8AC1
MEQITAPNSLGLREIILNARKPLILKSFNTQWPCFEEGLQKWCEEYDKLSGEKPEFEKMPLANEINEPQWERKRKLERMSAKEFLNEHSENGNAINWHGLNYKRKHELPMESTRGIDFGCFGFPKLTDDCTLWLSSKGANTPCHFDTYGCNIVVQIYGRKSWLLFPPDTNLLTTTRIPYEESSVYCLENFYAPSCEEMKQLLKLKGQCYHCILEPNDVLIVPRHWWHFVEAMEISLSVNAWIPLQCDIENQIEECIVKYFIDTFLESKNDAVKEYVRNPNQLSCSTSYDELFNILDYLVQQKDEVEKNQSDAKTKCSTHPYCYISEKSFVSLKNDFQNIFEVSLLTDNQWENYLKNNHKRSNPRRMNEKTDDKPLNVIEESLFNSICSPQNIQLVKHEFLRRYSKNK